MPVAGPKRDRKTPTNGFVPKRGRPTRSQVEAIDNSILSLARDLFLEHGYAATSMEAVAAAAGVSKGTLYARYPAKPDLFRAIVADRLAAWEGQTGPTKPDVTTIRAYLHWYGINFLSGVRNPEVAAFDRLIVAEAGRFPEVAEAFYQQGFLVNIAAMAAELERLLSGSCLTDPKGVASVFNAALLGWYRTEVIFGAPSDETCGRFVDRLVSLLLDGRGAW